MSDLNWVVELFSSIDQKNIDKFSSFISDDCLFRFGNLPAEQGATDVLAFVRGFFDSIKSLKHEIADTWTIEAGVVCHGMVTYTRHDNSVLSVPYSIILKSNNGKVYEYLIFADTSQLYS